MTARTWCRWHYLAVEQCDPASREFCRPVASPLGDNDEPQENGALVVVWAGDYRRQEVWVASGANIGNWYCLGGEFRRPKVWDDPRSHVDRLMSHDPAPARPPGTIPLQPTWSDVLARGPVSALTTGDGEAYRDGWRNGRRAMLAEIETLSENYPPA